jgi:pimeloyl-ACP methyl ester carboxylesterase
VKKNRFSHAFFVDWHAAVVLLVIVLGIGSCGTAFRFPGEVIRLVLPGMGADVVGDVQMPPRRGFAPVPLVVLLDDGPPVDIDPRRTVAAQIGALQTVLVQKGYAVWRPLRDAWPSDRLVVRCPDELASQVQYGLLTARQIPGVDTSRVILLGFGQGGVIATVVAARADRRVYALGLVGTPARSIDRALTSATFRDSVNVQRLNQFFVDIWGNTYADTANVMNGKVECWRSWVVLTGEMPDRIERLTQPILAVQGTADSLVPLLDIERIRRAIGRRPLSQIHSAAGLRHDLRDETPDPRQDPRAISPRFVDIVVGWLRLVATPPT